MAGVRAADWAEPEKEAWTAEWGTADDCEAQVAPGAEAEASPAFADEPGPGASQRAHARRTSGPLDLLPSPAWPPLLGGPDAPACRTAPVGPASPASQHVPACQPSPVVLARFSPHVRPSVVARVALAVDQASLAPGLVAPQQASPAAQVRFSLDAPASPSEASPVARFALAFPQVLVLAVQLALVVRAASLVQVALAPVFRYELGALLVAVVRGALVFVLVLVRVAHAGQVSPVGRPSPAARNALVGRLSPGALTARFFRNWAP